MILAETPIDTKVYGRLSAKADPAVVKSEAENERLLSIIEPLIARNESSLIGPKGRVSEILSGKRSVSKEQAKRLAAFFRVGVELFP